MGMFDKDEFFQSEEMDKWVDQDTPFILWGVSVTPSPIRTSIGEALGAMLQVSALDAPENRTTISTFASSIVNRVQDAAEGDFPCVVLWTKVPGSFNADATILKLVEPYNPESPYSPPTELGQDAPSGP
jgi:hypothetical protein